MFQVLVVDSGAIDREMMKSVLHKGLDGPVEIYLAGGIEEARTILEETGIDLMIADVPLSTAYVKNLVRTACGIHQNIDVILTTVKR